MGFAHLHLHTEYSLLDGACRIDQLMSAVKSLDQKAVAITDHGVMYGVIDFYKAAKKNSIKPIIGCEAYVASRTRHDKTHQFDSEHAHLILLCKNNTGYQNLIKMMSYAWIEGFYGRPRIDRELLEKYHEGLIALSACLAGEIPRALTQNDYSKAKEIAVWYDQLFGRENYYLELQNHGIKEQLEINPLILKISKETGIPIVATNDTHYISKEDHKTQQALICIQTNQIVGQETGFEFKSKEFYLKSEAEMRELFDYAPEAIENTTRIANRCNVEFEFGNTKLPYFETPDNENHFDYLKKLCLEGMIKRYGDAPPKGHYDRLEYELKIINDMGYADYFLIVYDFINYAKLKKIPVGPGRGSGAGSIAAYCIGITGIDPMKFNLLFERFLNPERVSMPDFDIDFCYERRSEVIDYVIEKYGEDHVSQIITFGTMAAKAAIRDVGRALGLPYAVPDSVAKLIPFDIGITIEKALGRSQELKNLYNTNEQIKELIDLAKKVEGMPRHASTHAAGVVITRDPVSSYVPLAKNDDAIVTQFTMTTLEELGLLKMDFLGLRTLTVISDAEKMVKQLNPDFDIDKIPFDDNEIFEALSKGQTDGVFQFESGGMRQVLINLKPESLEDMIAVISLYRPGPMESIPKYIENRHNPSKVSYKTPQLKNILDVTYGCMVYQEQVMQIFRELAGYSYGRADIVRRAMSKKKHDVMQKERQAFVYGETDSEGNIICDGCVRRGIDARIANEIFDEMESFASYAFNKSHAAAYAYLAYQTAYLKIRYPCEFMTALLTSVLDYAPKVAAYINECKRIKIEVIHPDVNESFEKFVAGNGKIRFGLLAIKNLGRGLINVIINERESSGKFKSFYDFCKRIYGKDFNRRAIESLIKCGAVDSLGCKRSQALKALDGIIASLESDKRRNIEGQIGFFDSGNDDTQSEYQLPDLEEFPRKELLKMEKDTIGVFISGHPLGEYEDIEKELNVSKIINILESGSGFVSNLNDGDSVNLFGIVSSVKLKTTRNDQTMAFLELEDTTGAIEIILFPQTLQTYKNLAKENQIALIKGKLSLREDEDPKIICDLMKSSSDIIKKNSPSVPTNTAAGKKTSESKLYLKIKSNSCSEFEKIKAMLEIFDGSNQVFIFFEDTKKYFSVPRKMRTDLNEIMLCEMRNILGEKNVVIVS